MKSRRLQDRLAGWYSALAPRDRRALRLGGIVLLPVLVWVGMVRPYFDTLSRMEDRIASERGLLERELAVLAEAPTYPAKLEEAASVLDAWERRLVHAANPAMEEADVMEVLEDLARKNRVLLREARAVAIPPAEPQPPGFRPIRMSVSGESDFEGLLALLHELERDSLLFRIVGISVDRRAAVGGQGNAGGGGGAPRPGRLPVTVDFVIVVDAFAPSEPVEL